MVQPSNERTRAVGGQTIVQQLRRQIARLINPHHVAARLFYGPDGKVTPQAAAWLAEFAERNFINRSTFDPDPRVEGINQGRRECALEVMASINLDIARLDDLQRQLREAEG